MPRYGHSEPAPFDGTVRDALDNALQSPRIRPQQTNHKHADSSDPPPNPLSSQPPDHGEVQAAAGGAPAGGTAPGVCGLSWSMGTGPAGRATWAYGPPIVPGKQHIVWKRIGGHDILTGP
ncbi:hypothetical protein [Streptomyces sp. NBC_00690]|uniref:hypothetical protein n=1 Tax=Streptomyces sp. NBC_00690 TaxID=2975808 RepID=UPI002E28BF85|nr:hypothetical protein [Streptomyces sp. NBC_00690]